MKRNAEKLAWAAGFFDGEGCVGLYKAGRGYYKDPPHKYPKVGINNIDKELLEKFKTIVNAGKIYGPYKHKRLEKANPIFSYKLDGATKIMELYRLLAPYLGSQKKTAFEKALKINPPLPQLAEGADSKSVQSEFESQGEDLKIYTTVAERFTQRS